MINERFHIAAVDMHSTLWRSLVEHHEAKLALLREQNDNLDKDPVQTAFLRGRINMVKEFLALGSKLPGQP